MKFKIRFADQIVGFFIVLSLASLVFVVVMLGRSQRWFAKDINYFTVLPSAGGLSKNMAVQYRGFTIGNIKDFFLTENDNVKVLFTIQEEYKDRVKLGSMVEMMINPIGLGNQFLFHPGSGEELDEGSLIPAVGTATARELIRQGLALEPQKDDSISLLMNRASSALDGLDKFLVQLNDAIGPRPMSDGEETEISEIVSSVRKITSGLEVVPGTVNRTIDEIRAEIVPVIADIGALTDKLNDPSNLLYTVLDTDQDVYQNLVKSLNSLSGILDGLDRTVAFVPSQLPQLAGLLMELRVTIKTAEEVLVALTNNPLLRKGVPTRPESQGGGTGPRDIRF